MNLGFPTEILSYILTFLDIKYKKKTIFYIDKFSNKKRKIVSKVNYYPSKIFLIDKFWFKSILYSRCKICMKSNYNLYQKKCMCCGHVMESDLKKKERLKYINNIKN